MMKWLVAVGLVLYFAAMVSAVKYTHAANEPIAREARLAGGNYVRVFDVACAHPALKLALMRVGAPHEPKNARVHWDGVDYAACWFERDGYVFVLDEAGDGGALPASAFKHNGI